MTNQKNIHLYYAINFLQACLFMTPVWYFFFTVYHDFGISEAIFLGVFSGIIKVLFEVPSGAWADRLGRKRNFVIGIITSIIGFSIFLVGSEFWHFMVSGIFYGIGSAMASGNLEASIHDSLGSGKKAEKQYDLIQSRQYMFLFTGKGIACILGGFLFLYHPLLPIVGTLICYILLLVLFLHFDTGKQEKSIAKNSTIHIQESLAWLIKNKKELYILVFAGVILIGIGNIYWNSYQPLLDEHNFKIWFIGIIYFLISIFSAIGSFTIGKLQQKFTSFSILHGLFICLLVCSVLLWILPHFYIIIPIIILAFSFGFIEPLVQSHLLKSVPKTHKSTILSLFGLSIGCGFFACSTVAGFFADLFSLNTVYLALICIIFCVIVFDHLFIQKYIHSTHD